jgi:putative transposase
MDTSAAMYRRHRFPGEIISHCVWLYFRFCLSCRDIEELTLVRGVFVTYEAIRQWRQKFGQPFANELRRRRLRPGAKWHLDEIFAKINGQIHYLWRAIDQAGVVLDILVQPHRDKAAAERFFWKLLKGLAHVPRVLITDKLQSYGGTKPRFSQGSNIATIRDSIIVRRTPISPRGSGSGACHRFKSPGRAQRFLLVHGAIASHFRTGRRRLGARVYRQRMVERFQTWRAVTGLAA